MEIILAIGCVILAISTICDAVIEIRNFIYQKKWDKEKYNIIRDDPAVTAAELCTRYVDFCEQNHCSVDY